MADRPSSEPAQPTTPGLAGVVVLGMHRSGTSAVNGCFRAAGYHVSVDQDIIPADERQPGGYNESRTVVRLNDEILINIGRNWFEPPTDEEFERVMEAGSQLIASALTALQTNAAGAPIALKDPRISIMMPLWGPMIEGLLHPVLVIRDPIEVAASITKREGTPRPIALAGWEMSMAAVLEHLNGRQVTVVHQRELMESPEVAVEIVRSVTELLRPELAARVDPGRAADNLKPSLHRNRSSGVEHYRALTQYQQDLWNFLSSLPAGRQVLAAPAELTIADPDSRTVTRAETERMTLIRQLQQANEKLGEMAQVLQQAHEHIRATQAEAAARPPAADPSTGSPQPPTGS